MLDSIVDRRHWAAVAWCVADNDIPLRHHWVERILRNDAGTALLLEWLGAVGADVALSTHWATRRALVATLAALRLDVDVGAFSSLQVVFPSLLALLGSESPLGSDAVDALWRTLALVHPCHLGYVDAHILRALLQEGDVRGAEDRAAVWTRFCQHAWEGCEGEPQRCAQFVKVLIEPCRHLLDPSLLSFCPELLFSPPPSPMDGGGAVVVAQC